MCLVRQTPCGAKGRRSYRKRTKRGLLQPKLRRCSKARVLAPDGWKRYQRPKPITTTNQASLLPVSGTPTTGKNVDLHQGGLQNRKSDHHRNPFRSVLDPRSRLETYSRKSPSRSTGPHSDMVRLRELKHPNRLDPLHHPSLPPNELLPRSPSLVVGPYLPRLMSLPLA